MTRSQLIGYVMLATALAFGAFGVGYFLGLGLVAAGVGR